jgi:hypothetical protein
MFGHDLGRDKPYDGQDAEGDDYQVVEIAEDWNKVRYEVDRA